MKFLKKFSSTQIRVHEMCIFCKVVSFQGSSPVYRRLYYFAPSWVFVYTYTCTRHVSDIAIKRMSTVAGVKCQNADRDDRSDT